MFISAPSVHKLSMAHRETCSWTKARLSMERDEQMGLRAVRRSQVLSYLPHPRWVPNAVAFTLLTFESSPY
uniref:Uncharacterized protein n=1 Tax=Steinernema glaseri TaxID=37863 RepID=A0A1I7ZPH9_9BILA